MADKKLKIAVLVSGRGSNLQALIDAINSGYIKDAKIDIILSNKADSYALKRGDDAGIETLFLDPKTFKDKEAYDLEVISILKTRGVELICLAGFMRIISPAIIHAFKYKIINIHPSLLPSFPGLNAQKQALDHGVKVSGCTVHFVDEGVDTGPIILQSAVTVNPDDDEVSLSEKILTEEHKIYVEAVKLFSEGRLELAGRRVLIL